MTTRDCVQCAAPTKRGNRCKNRTCMYTEFCSVHTRLLLNLKVADSTIKGSGKGLFTLMDIKKGTKIIQYTGTLMSATQYDKNDTGYGASVSKSRVIDASSTQSTLGRYANDCRAANIRKKECRGTNARFSVSYKKDQDPAVWIKATKNIKKGSEIFISYSRYYWKESEKFNEKKKKKARNP